PRDFAVAGDRLHVAHEHSDTLTTFALSPESGLPAPLDGMTHLPAPACLLEARVVG
ncbi:MAG: beta-propeller fold lactonase family protein, partial [Pseudonocardia sp.]